MVQNVFLSMKANIEGGVWMSKQFCEVCFEQTNFNRIEVKEEVTVKDLTFTVNHEYDVCENCGEMFEPIEDVDKNLKEDYRVYREKVGFLQPKKIKKIREKYHMNLRQFAELLGIGYSTLSHIENGSLQSWYQNSLFVLVESPQAMYNLLKDRIKYTNENYEGVMERVEELCKKEAEEFFRVAKHLEKQIELISEKTLINTRRLNDIQFGLNQLNNKEYKDVAEKEKSYSWTEIPTNMFQLN